MKKAFLKAVFAATFLTAPLVDAAALKAELIMPGGRSWKGQVVGRDGDWIEFSTGANPIRIGAGTIEELAFDISLDEDKLNELYRNREYKRVIDILEKTLQPYRLYSDIPSNLTRFNSMLMELHYKSGDYDKSLELATSLASDARDPAMQDKSRVYRALSLIDAGRPEEAEKLLAEFGWGAELDDTSPPEKLYITAKLLALKKQYAKAMELTAKVVAFNSQDPDWIQPAELLCAELYTELGMYESAEEVVREISLLYKNTNEDDLAQKLKIRIEKLRAEKAIAEAAESDEA